MEDCERCGTTGAEEVVFAVVDAETDERDREETIRLCPACTAFMVGLVRSMTHDASVN